MFKAVVSILMLCSLGAHSVLGCCWHHDHAEHDQETPARSEDQLAQQQRGHVHFSCGHHHHHADPVTETDSENAPEPSHPHVPVCEVLPCQYVLGTPTKLPVPDRQVLEVPAENGTTRIGMSESQTLRFQKASRPTLSGYLAVRAGIQVWLL